MELLRTLALLASTLGVGLTAGVFFAYTTSVMPGLRRIDDRSFVTAFQALDRAIMNPLFLAIFMGGLLLPLCTALLHLGGDHRRVLAWTAAAFVLYLGAFVITVRVNVPLNDAVKAAGDPDGIDVAAVRERFDERKWARWNLVRTALSTAALLCLALAMV
ncbi:anthrone oxygenase family protein [Glycomyces tarimensis]